MMQCDGAPRCSYTLTFVIFADFDNFRVRVLRGVGPRGLVHDGVFVVRELVHALHEFLLVPLVLLRALCRDFRNPRFVEGAM